MRMTKGDASRYFVKQARETSDELRKAVLDGELVSVGLIDAEKSSGFAGSDELRNHPAGHRILTFYAIEAWLRSWKAHGGERIL